MNQYDIFISYSRIDSQLAAKIQEILQKAGFKCFRDVSIHTGDAFMETLANSIIESRVFLLLGSSHAYKSRYTRKEIKYAFDKNKLILPYLIDDTNLPKGLEFLLSDLNKRCMKEYPINSLIQDLKDIIPHSTTTTPTPSRPPFIEGKPVTFSVNGISFNMMPVNAGKFIMGSKEKNNGYPAHEVRLLKNYYIGETEVTQALWQTVMGNNPSTFKKHDLPVEQVSWNDCQLFIAKLNKITKCHFRLPTEAEWEFAARGGNHFQGDNYAGSSEVWNVAWYNGNSQQCTHPVKLKVPNELGIYDMSGNVNEWCFDLYGNYSDTPRIDPHGAKSGEFRVIRGGSWYESEVKCRIYIRNRANPSIKSANLGLRLTLSYGS